MRQPLRKLPFLALAILLSMTACEKDDDAKADEAKEATEAARKVPVEAVSASLHDMRETIVSTSAVDARSAVDVAAQIPGVVADIAVEVGDEVDEGQLIARIRREELGLGVDTASAAVRRLQREVDRLKPLYEKGILAQQAYDEAVYRLEEAQAEQKRARTVAGDARVVAPMDGVVAARHVDVGQQVATGSPLFRVVDPAELVVHVNLPESVLGEVFEKQDAYVVSDALDGAEFDGVVERISPVVDPRTGTVRVTIRLGDQALAESGADRGARPEMRLRPGMFVKAHIVTDAREGVVAVPRRAVTRTDDQAHVFVVADDLAERRAVTLGITEGSRVEITSGLEAGEAVVVLGQEGLKEGTAVVVELRPTAQVADGS